MPIPVSSTHPRGEGLEAAENIVIETEGPFSRLKRQTDADVSANSGDNSLVAGASTGMSGSAADVDPIVVNNLHFSYPGIDGRPLPGRALLLDNLTFRLPAGSRCLLVGPNGAGKTTFLKILGGKHMIPQHAVSVLGRPPFHDTGLITEGLLTYIGGNWERDIAFAGYHIPISGDVLAGEMLRHVPDTDPARRQRLVDVMDINPRWHMHLVSEGQRRRVQIALGLLREYKVLLLDEVTVDLDVLGRADLMAFLQQECRERGTTVVYATHIFDGLEAWPTHIALLAQGGFKVFQRREDIPELRQGGRFLDLVAGWLREDYKARMKAREAA